MPGVRTDLFQKTSLGLSGPAAFNESVIYQDLLITPSFSHLCYSVQLLDIKMPESASDDPWSQENLEQYVRHFASTQHQPVGTCKMGPADDKTAVVDNHLRYVGFIKHKKHFFQDHLKEY